MAQTHRFERGGKNEAQRMAHHKKMTETPVEKLIGTLAIPSILTMMTTSIYNTADTYFVSQLGTSASGAVGVCLSLMTLIQTAGFTLGMGSCNYVAKLLGEQKDREASEAASTGFFAAIFFGMFVTVMGTIFLPWLMKVMGATDTILPYAQDYARYILFAAPLMGATCMMNSVLRGEGKSKFGMIGMMAGGILNIILDPIFIFKLNLGITGAAMATAVSQAVSFCILLSMFLRRKSNVWLGITYVRDLKVLWPIIALGSPTMCRQGMNSFATIALNHAAGPYGDAAIAAMGIVNRLHHLMNNVVTGMNQGYQPVSGYNYGARKYGRVRDATRFIAVSATILKVIISAIVFVLAEPIITLFRADDPAVISFGTTALRLTCLTAPLMGMYTAASTSYQSTGRSLLALSLAFTRQGILYIPMMLVLPRFIGALGIQLVTPLTDLICAIISFPFYIRFMREMQQLEKETNMQSPKPIV